MESSPASKNSTAKTIVSDQISHAIISTHNLLQFILQSSPSQDNLLNLPKNLLAKSSTINNTHQVLEQMPLVISSLDAYMDNGLHSVSHLETVTRLLCNIENNQLKPLANNQFMTEEPKPSSGVVPEST